MNRQFCGLVLCGLACLTVELSNSACGADVPAVSSYSLAAPSQAGLPMEPQFHAPLALEEHVDYGMQEHPGPIGHGPIGHGPIGHDPIGHDPIGYGSMGPVMGDELGIVPPGTLGQSYTRVSYPVPIDKHPRTGMLAVKDNGTVPYMTVGIMGGLKMKNGIWLFESTRPLDPGACQIIRVEARETPQDIAPYATRFVRLIPGRIVFLEF